MSTQNFNYIFNITDNASSTLNDINAHLTQVSQSASNAVSSFSGFEKTVIFAKNFANIIMGVANAISCTLEPAIALDSSLKDLSAITGETGEGLKLIEKYARQSARTFGGSAAQAVESYKLVLSQLSPEIAKCPEALRAMGDHIATLSKTMGGDATAAAEVLTTAMNQFGVDLSDPIRSAEVMAEMMNVMAAAGREGSAELPQIKQALELMCRSKRQTQQSKCSTKQAKKVLKVVSRFAMRSPFLDKADLCQKMCERNSQLQVLMSMCLPIVRFASPTACVCLHL